MFQSKKLAHGDGERRPGIVKRLAFSHALKEKPRDQAPASR
ncbi:MAG: hypothetical protein V1827_06460 [Candidatus Micrarchaeota archaeon]